jgi:hypothetical protein
MHRANYPSQLAGCIAPGSALTGRSGEWGVANSRDALDAILDWWGDRDEDRILISD